MRISDWSSDVCSSDLGSARCQDSPGAWKELRVLQYRNRAGGTYSGSGLQARLRVAVTRVLSRFCGYKRPQNPAERGGGDAACGRLSQRRRGTDNANAAVDRKSVV